MFRVNPTETFQDKYVKTYILAYLGPIGGQKRPENLAHGAILHTHLK